MIFHRLSFFLGLICLGCLSCDSSSPSELGGGAEAGNPPPPAERDIIGDVMALDLPSPHCAADTVVALNTSLTTYSFSINETDCSFTLTLPANQSYVISFKLEEQYVGTLIFSSDPSSFSTVTFYVGEGESPIDLGTIVFEDYNAIPENDPASQVDQDGDGLTDDLDDDDNGNGVPDSEETDQSLDGIPDEQTDEEESSITVYEVVPRNNSGISSFILAVANNSLVQIRLSCEMDTASVNASTFQILSSQGDPVDCVYQLIMNGHAAECRHESDLFNYNTLYTATLSGASCVDGTPIPTTSWSWMTPEGPPPE